MQKSNIKIPDLQKKIQFFTEFTVAFIHFLVLIYQPCLFGNFSFISLITNLTGLSMGPSIESGWSAAGAGGRYMTCPPHDRYDVPGRHVPSSSWTYDYSYIKPL